MAIYLGDTEISKVYLGDTEIDAAAIGDTSVFSSEPLVPDIPGVLTLNARRVSGRSPYAIDATVTDTDGISSITHDVLTASDGQTREDFTFTRTDANTFTSETLSFRNARWVSGSMSVDYVDARSGQTRTVSSNYRIDTPGTATAVRNGTTVNLRITLIDSDRIVSVDSVTFYHRGFRQNFPLGYRVVEVDANTFWVLTTSGSAINSDWDITLRYTDSLGSGKTATASYRR